MSPISCTRMTKYTFDRVPRLQRLNHTPQITAISQYLLPIKLHVRIDSQGEPSRAHRHRRCNNCSKQGKARLSTIFTWIKFHPPTTKHRMTQLSSPRAPATSSLHMLCKYGCAQLLLLLLTKGIVGQEKLCLLRNRTSDFIAVEDATSTYLRFTLLVLCVSGFSFFCFLPTTPSSMPRQTSISIGPKNSSPQFSPCAQTFNYSVSSSMFLTRSPPWMVKEGVQST